MHSTGTDTDRRYMELALSLAEKGRGHTSPNPMVGAVIVLDGEIVGQGFHRKAGDDHAEIMALREAGECARGATLYVTLEPCCHFGKTPPCSESIIKNGIKRVVAAMTDPNPLVCGGGFTSLHRHHIEIESGVLEDRARKLNEAYFKYIRTKIPFVTLKLAMTLDGRIADRDGGSRWITGPEARKRVHLLRAWSDAVMVGAGTVLADNPRLTVRDAEGSNPWRIILDSHLRSPLDSHVFDDTRVIVVTGEKPDTAKLPELGRRGIEVWQIESKEGKISLNDVLRKMGERSMTSLLCEGGSALATTLLREGFVDKLCIFFAPKILGRGIEGVGDLGIQTIDRAVHIGNRELEELDDDILITGYPEYKDIG
jgi:diaminohydroxyphosphoribosylaminopyrimidine deaminase / 5-amino-6-(5-phosphoribosylamino)uracil reductase